MSETTATVCRVSGCICLPAPASQRPRKVRTEGVCAIHQQLSDDELAVLLKRRAGLIGPLEPLDGGRIEYERADGTRYVHGPIEWPWTGTGKIEVR